MSEYKSNKVFSESERLHLPWQAWLWAIIWNAAVWFAIVKVGDKLRQILEQEPIFYFIALFPFIGLWLIIAAVKTTRAAYKFGKSAVVLDPFPSQAGGQCAGYLDLALAIKKTTQAKISLTCIRRSYYSNPQSDSFDGWRNEPLWQDRATVAIENRGQNSRIDFAFEPPLDLPASEEESRDYHLWQLHIKIPMAGIDYDRVFEIPMITADAAMQASHQRYASQTISNNASVENDASLPPSVSETLSGTQFYYGYGRSKLIAFFLMTFAIVIGLMNYFIFADFLDFLTVTSTLLTFLMSGIALTLFLIGIFLIASSMTIEVGLNGIRKQQNLVGFNFEETVNSNELVEITVEKEGSSTVGNDSHVWFKLQAIKADGSKVQVGDTLLGHSYTENIKQQMLSALGMTWRPASLNNEQQNKSPMPIWLRRIGKGISYLFSIALLYDVIRALPQIMDFIK